MRQIQKYILLVFLGIFSGCKSSVPTFSGDMAFQFLEQQCAFGPRNPGSEGYAVCKEYYLQKLGTVADTIFTQSFTLTETRTDETYSLSNIIARFQPDAERQILLGAHWDTRPWADRDPDIARRDEPILGANDGASGVAILMECAEIFYRYPPPIGVTIVLFDGEDLGREGDPESYAQGSKYFAEHLPIAKPESAIILDMVGDAELNIPIERNSLKQNPQLVRKLWKIAEELKLPAFKQWLGPAIYDDHIPLWEKAGIPAVDIIDFRYPNRFTNYWHTHQDTPIHCSASSLAQVGDVIIHYLYDSTQKK